MNRMLQSLASMHEFTFYLLKCGIVLSCLLLLSTIVILVHAGPFSPDTYTLHQYAQLMFQLSFVVLLETVLGTVLVEERLCLQKK